LAEPYADELAVDDLRLLEVRRCEIDEAANRVDDIVEVEAGDRSARLTEATAERVSHRALARGDRSDNDNEVRHPTTLIHRADRPSCAGRGHWLRPEAVRFSASRSGRDLGRLSSIT